VHKSVGKKRNLWLVINGRKQHWPMVNVQELEKRLIAKCGKDYSLVQNGRKVELTGIKDNQMIRVYSRLRGGMFSGLFARFAPKRDGCHWT
jgi:hypothetical protein